MSPEKTLTFSSNKLWRDKAVDKIEKTGAIVNWHRLSDDEFRAQLLKKLKEETQEVCDSLDQENLIEEIADVYEVLDTLCQLNGIDKKDVIQAQQTKREQRGGFEGRKYVESSTHSADHWFTQYCLKHPDKYPQID